MNKKERRKLEKQKAKKMRRQKWQRGMKELVRMFSESFAESVKRYEEAEKKFPY